jgi:cell division protein FtsB
VAAGYILFQFEFLLYSGRNLLEVQLHLNAQVRAAITALLLRATAAETASNIAIKSRKIFISNKIKLFR